MTNVRHQSEGAAGCVEMSNETPRHVGPEGDPAVDDAARGLLEFGAHGLDHAMRRAAAQEFQRLHCRAIPAISCG